MTRLLRCHAEQSGDGWEATCLDLDIAVQGDSFEEVYSALQEAIALYLETVADLPEGDRRRLLNRPAPLPSRLRFLGYAIRNVLSESLKGRTASADFTLPMAA
jgi:predicted RNase H-like HicB family nuclease